MLKTINIPNQENVRLLLFPDNQPHCTLEGIETNDEVKVVAPIRSSLELFQLLAVSNALSHFFARKRLLLIPYLMGARSDRVMTSGGSFDLEVVAQAINSCGFEHVVLVDVHSDVALGLIKNSYNIDNTFLVQEYDHPSAVLICPDHGAEKKMGRYLAVNKNLVDVVYCEKHRELSTGKITLKVVEPEKCLGRNCVIIDDLVDGAGTFIAIAEQIKPSHLTLIVTHGIFSKGFGVLEQHFQEIITTDSYCNHGGSKILKTVPLNL